MGNFNIGIGKTHDLGGAMAADTIFSCDNGVHSLSEGLKRFCTVKGTRLFRLIHNVGSLTGGYTARNQKKENNVRTNCFHFASPMSNILGNQRSESNELFPIRRKLSKRGDKLLSYDRTNLVIVSTPNHCGHIIQYDPFPKLTDVIT